MNLNQLDFNSEEFFDSVLEQYESSWSNDHCGAENILNFFSSISGIETLTPAACNSVFVELSMIDLERWWINWQQRVPHMVDQTIDLLLEEFSRRATVENYLRLFINAANRSNLAHSLARCEIAARDNWGDQIGLPYFRNCLGFNEVDYRPQDVKRVVLSCARDGSRHLPPLFPVRGRTIVGRQRSFDSSDSLAQELPEGNRIVVASRTEPEISREQLTIQLLCPDYAVVMNTSNVNPIELDGARAILPQESLAIRIPFVIHLPGRRLSIFQVTNVG